MIKKSFILVLIMLLFFCGSVIVSNGNNSNTYFLSANYKNDYSNEEGLKTLEYNFKGCIISKITTSQFNGNGIDIPYTYYYVKIEDVIKGSIEEEIVVIKYYGGYDQNNNLILFDGMELPIIEENYIFYCNKTKSNFDLDGRTINNSYVIDNKYKIKNQSKEDDNNISTRAINFPIPDDGNDGAVDPDNFTFDTAKVISLDYYAGMYIGPSKTRYYKFTCTTTDYISIYSTGDYDPQIFIYDSERDLIAYDDNDDELLYLRNPSIVLGNNFYINFLGEESKTYYAAIELSDYSSSGSFAVQFKIDNWSNQEVTEYITGTDLVNNSNEINYEINSSYITEINYSINEWNKLGAVKIQPRTGMKIRNLTIKDVDDIESDILGYVASGKINYTFKNISLNKSCFEEMNSNQRIHTILHELGHALGIDEMEYEYSINVMVQGLNSLTQLGPADIAVYREIWGYGEDE